MMRSAHAHDRLVAHERLTPRATVQTTPSLTSFLPYFTIVQVSSSCVHMPSPSSLSSSSSLPGFFVVCSLLLLLPRFGHAFLLAPPPPTTNTISISTRPSNALHARVGGGFGFGKRVKGAAEEDDPTTSKFFDETIYSPYAKRRPVPPYDSTPCACGSGESYANCCFPLHKGLAKAQTPEALLRSRYTAYLHGFPKYLLSSTHPSSEPMRPKREKAYLQLLDIACSEENLEQLQVGVQEAGETEREAFITFRVKRHVWMSERSKFLKGEDGGWLFLDEQV